MIFYLALWLAQGFGIGFLTIAYVSLAKNRDIDWNDETKMSMFKMTLLGPFAWLLYYIQVRENKRNG